MVDEPFTIKCCAFGLSHTNFMNNNSRNNKLFHRERRPVKNFESLTLPFGMITDHTFKTKQGKITLKN